jgi:hypothetical protein
MTSGTQICCRRWMKFIDLNEFIYTNTCSLLHAVEKPTKRWIYLVSVVGKSGSLIFYPTDRNGSSP